MHCAVSFHRLANRQRSIVLSLSIYRANRTVIKSIFAILEFSLNVLINIAIVYLCKFYIISRAFFSQVVQFLLNQRYARAFEKIFVSGKRCQLYRKSVKKADTKRIKIYTLG